MLSLQHFTCIASNMICVMEGHLCPITTVIYILHCYMLISSPMLLQYMKAYQILYNALYFYQYPMSLLARRYQHIATLGRPNYLRILFENNFINLSFENFNREKLWE